jgi:hypothetical protein
VPHARPARQGGGDRRHARPVCLAWSRLHRLGGWSGVGARPQEYTDGNRAYRADLSRPH